MTHPQHTGASMTKRNGVIGIVAVLLFGLETLAVSRAGAQSEAASVSVITKSGFVPERVIVDDACVVIVSRAGANLFVVPCCSSR